MTEFKEIIKIKNRICKKYSTSICLNCPLNIENNNTGEYCEGFLQNFPIEFEQVCLKWAEENPAMTNGDKLKEIFPDVIADFCPSMLGFECNKDICCADCRNKWLNTEYQPPRGGK